MQTKNFIAFILFLGSFLGKSQDYLGLQFNNTHIGNNYGVQYERKFNNLKFGIGTTLLINNDSDVATSTVFKNLGYANNLKERIGFNFNVLRKLYGQPNKYVLFIGYQFYYSHSGIRSLALFPEPGISQQVGIKLYSLDYVKLDAYYSLEHNLAINFDVYLSPKFIFSQTIGSGFAARYDLDFSLGGESLPTNFILGQGWEVCYFYSLSIKYVIKRKKDN